MHRYSDERPPGIEPIGAASVSIPATGHVHNTRRITRAAAVDVEFRFTSRRVSVEMDCVRLSAITVKNEPTIL